MPINGFIISPFCVNGKRACPFEYVGGVWGYEEFIEKWNDKSHPGYDDIRNWAAGFHGSDIFELPK